KLLFQFPTILQLAEYLEKDAPKLTSRRLLLHQNTENLYDPFPLTDCQRAYLVGQSGALSVSNISSHLYRELNFSQLNVDKLEASLNHLIQRHPAMRMVVVNDTQQFLREVPLYRIEVLFDQLQTYVRNEMSHQIFSGKEWPLF